MGGHPSPNGCDTQPFTFHRGELVASDDAGELAAVGRLVRRGAHRRVAPHGPARGGIVDEGPSMYEMEGPSPGLRGESYPISRVLSPLGLHRASRPSDAPVTRRFSRGITSPRGFPRSSDLSSAAFGLGDVSFLLPPGEPPQGVRPTFSRFFEVSTALSTESEGLSPEVTSFFTDPSTSRDEVRPRDGTPSATGR